MTRFILLTILNLSLPFLVRWLWIIIQNKRRKNNPQVIDITPTPHFPIVKLLAIGLVLLACSLIFLRFWNIETDTWESGNPAVSRDY